MGAENAAELVELGGKIATLCSQLAEVREKRDELSKQVADLEKELTPLLTRHAELIAKLAGAALPRNPPVPQHPQSTVDSSTSDGSIPRPNQAILEKRIVRFLEQADPGVGALEIAQALNIDAATVRETLRTIMDRARGKSASLPVDPDTRTH